jgi:hypothetical protein
MLVRIYQAKALNMGGKVGGGVRHGILGTFLDIVRQKTTSVRRFLMIFHGGGWTGANAVRAAARTDKENGRRSGL